MTRLAVQINVFRTLSMIDWVKVLEMKETLRRASGGVRDVDDLASFK